MEKDHLGLYVYIEQGVRCHTQRLGDGGCEIREVDGNFKVIDYGAYGDYEQDEGTYDTLEEAYNVFKDWT